jgi:hypothetical protein
LGQVLVLSQQIEELNIALEKEAGDNRVRADF